MGKEEREATEMGRVPSWEGACEIGEGLLQVKSLENFPFCAAASASICMLLLFVTLARSSSSILGLSWLPPFGLYFTLFFSGRLDTFNLLFSVIGRNLKK